MLVFPEDFHVEASGGRTSLNLNECAGGKK